MTALSGLRLTPLGFASVMPATTHICTVALGSSRTRFAHMAQLVPRLRMGHAVGRVDDSHFGAVCDLSRHRRARARHTFQPGMDAGEHAVRLGRSTLGSGATIIQAAIAVTVSAIRLFPMVVSVMPMMRTPETKRRELVLVAHLTAVTLWVECFRFLPHVPRERRIAFVHGLGSGLVSVCLVATTVGYALAANLSPLLGAAILMLTPLAFLFSTARNCREPADFVALALGLALFPLASMLDSGVDILLSGVSAGTIAYGVHWWREQQ